MIIEIFAQPTLYNFVYIWNIGKKSSKCNSLPCVMYAHYDYAIHEYCTVDVTGFA